MRGCERCGQVPGEPALQNSMVRDGLGTMGFLAKFLFQCHTSRRTAAKRAQQIVYGDARMARVCVYQEKKARSSLLLEISTSTAVI